jgi:hypothetical protein
MKLFLIATAIFAAAAVQAQTVANTSNVMHPLTKRNGRHAISSIDNDPEMAAEFRNNYGQQNGARHKAGEVEKAPAIVAQIDHRLQPSDISIIGTLSGLKCSFNIKNVSAKSEIPKIVLAVCDRKGFKIGTAIKTGAAIAPDETEKIDILATNVDGADVKLMKLTAASAVSE